MIGLPGASSTNSEVELHGFTADPGAAVHVRLNDRDAVRRAEALAQTQELPPEMLAITDPGVSRGEFASLAVQLVK